MATMRSLSGWWCCEVGCCMWLLIRYMLLRLSVNICVSVWVVFMAMSMAFNSALRIFWYPGNLFDIWMLLLGLYTPNPAVLLAIWPAEFLDGGINDPSVYMHCCGWYLRGCWWWYIFGRGIGVVEYIEWVLFFGVFFHVFENLMW